MSDDRGRSGTTSGRDGRSGTVADDGAEGRRSGTGADVPVSSGTAAGTPDGSGASDGPRSTAVSAAAGVQRAAELTTDGVQRVGTATVALLVGGLLAAVAAVATWSPWQGLVVGGTTALVAVAAGFLPSAGSRGTSDGASGGSPVAVRLAAETAIGVAIGCGVGAVVVALGPVDPLLAVAGFLVGALGLWLASRPLRRSLPDALGAAVPDPGRAVVAGVWVGIAVGSALIVGLLLRFAAVGDGLAPWVAVGVAVALPAGAVTRIPGAILARAIHRYLGEAGRRWLGRSRQVLVRVPVFDLPRLGRILADEEAVATIRLLVVGTLAFSSLYTLSPLDLIPDVLVPIGWIDDVTVYLVLREVVYTGYDHETGVREAVRIAVRTRLRRILVAVLLLVVVAAVLTVSGIGLVFWG